MTNEQIFAAAYAAFYSVDFVIDVVLSIIVCKIYRLMLLHLCFEAKTNEREAHAILWSTTLSIWIIFKSRLFE